MKNLIRHMRFPTGTDRFFQSRLILAFFLLVAGLSVLPAFAQHMTRHGDVISVSGDRIQVRMIAPYRAKTGGQGYIFTTNTLGGRISEVKAATIRVLSIQGSGENQIAVCRLQERFRPVTDEYWFGAIFEESSSENQAGTIFVMSTPAGASVMVDGQRRGITPMRADFPPGAHTVQVTLTGYATETRDVRVSGGETVSIDLFMNRMRAMEEGRSGEFYYQKGVVLFEIGDYDRAVVYLQRAVDLLPEHTKAQELLDKSLALTNRKPAVKAPVAEKTPPPAPVEQAPQKTPSPVTAPPVITPPVITPPVAAPVAAAPPPVTTQPAPVMAASSVARGTPPPGWTGKNPDGLESWRKSARQAIEKNDLRGAEVYVRNILDWNPNDPEARAWMARIIGPAPTITHKDEQSLIFQLPDGQELKMVRIPGGTFDMGDTGGDGDPDEKPVHPITVFDFWMGVNEVTNGQYAMFLNAWGNQFEESTYWIDINDDDCQIAFKDGKYTPEEGMEARPVVEVTWFGSMAFAKWLGGRLPTEAEWEYAARNGGRNLKFPTGGTLTSNDANLSGVSGQDQWEPASPVGSFPANPLGLYDIAGNVWEWCQDWYAREYYSNSRGTNPDGPPFGDARILRGGSWYDTAKLARTSYRNMNRPNESRINIGFRVVIPGS